MRRLGLYLLGLGFCLLQGALWSLPALVRPVAGLAGLLPAPAWRWLCRKNLEAQLTFHY